jgi:hypothetical protein
MNAASLNGQSARTAVQQLIPMSGGRTKDVRPAAFRHRPVSVDADDRAGAACEPVAGRLDSGAPRLATRSAWRESSSKHSRSRNRLTPDVAPGPRSTSRRSRAVGRRSRGRLPKCRRGSAAMCRTARSAISSGVVERGSPAPRFRPVGCRPRSSWRRLSEARHLEPAGVDSQD